MCQLGNRKQFTLSLGIFAFDEGSNRTRKDYSAFNPAFIRRMVLNFIRNEKTSSEVGWMDNDNMIQVLTGGLSSVLFRPVFPCIN